MKPNRVLSDVAIQLNLPGIATVRAPFALRRTAVNPLALPESATVPAPGVLVGVQVGGRRVRGKKSGYVANLPEPVETGRFVRLEGQERLDAAVPCLRRALALIQRKDGWCKHALCDDKGRVSLNGALQLGAKDALGVYFAREVIRRVIYENDFTAWNDHPFRVRADVVRALKTALKVCGAHKRRGGWVVSR